MPKPKQPTLPPPAIIAPPPKPTKCRTCTDPLAADWIRRTLQATRDAGHARPAMTDIWREWERIREEYGGVHLSSESFRRHIREHEPLYRELWAR